MVAARAVCKTKCSVVKHCSSSCRSLVSLAIARRTRWRPGIDAASRELAPGFRASGVRREAQGTGHANRTFSVEHGRSKPMTPPARQSPRREAAPLPSKVEDNTLDEQHAG